MLLGIGRFSHFAAVVCDVFAAAVLLGLTGTWLLGCRCFLQTSKRSSYWADELPLPGPGGRIWMSHAPGKFRTLREDLAQVKSYQVDLVVTLLSEEEMEILGLNHMGAAVEAEGMSWKYVELRDKWIPWDA